MGIINILGRDYRLGEKVAILGGNNDPNSDRSVKAYGLIVGMEPRMDTVDVKIIEVIRCENVSDKVGEITGYYHWRIKPLVEEVMTSQICTCDIWVGPCTCGVFKKEMKEKYGNTAVF